MRVDELLADLEAAQAALARVQQWQEIADTVRVENAAVKLVDRARAGIGRGACVHVAGRTIRGTNVGVSAQWLAIDTESSAIADSTADLVRRGVRVIDWRALESFSVTDAKHAQDGQSVIGRTWNALFRACATARTSAVWHTTSGNTYTGVIGAVGADHVILTDGGAHTALATAHLAILEPFVGRPDGREFQKSSRMRPA